MNKKLFLIALITLIGLINRPAFALSSTDSATTSTKSASPTPAPSTKAQELLDRVATQVAQLANQMKRTYTGSVKSIGTNSLVLSTSDGDKTVNTNDATDFFRIKGGSQSTIDFKKIVKGDDVAAIGTIDPQTQEMTAKQIIAKIHRFNFVGTISTLDTKRIATVTLLDNTQVSLDLTSAADLSKLTGGKFVQAKYADLASGSAILAIAYSPDPKTGVYSVLKAIEFAK